MLPEWGLSRPSGLAGLLAVTAVLAAPSVALANPTKTINGMVSLEGAQVFDTLTVTSTGIITVPAFAKDAMGNVLHTGKLDLKANKITVQAMGAIVADAAGYLGVPGMPGGCSTMSLMCAQAGSMSGQPGGGGGYFAAGANGTTEMTAGTCVDLTTAAAGGAPFFSMATKMLDLGSAGGASNLTGPATAGYAGGGWLSLSAAVIVIDGTVSANGGGWDGKMAHVGGVGPGGGSGGSIEIAAASLMGMGIIAVNGGAGAHGAGVGTTPPPNNGGGGSGGVVLLHLPPGLTNVVTVQTNGGKTGDCTTLSGGSGGTVEAPLTDSCIDVDGDSYESTACGKDDCDDSDPNVHPGAPEVCNGIDDNCDGKIDEAPNNCTKIGLVCGMANGTPACVSPNDGGSDGGDVPHQIAFGGGCAVGFRGDIAGAVATGTLALLALAVRRRRRR
jgi:hypothetical protein